MHRVYVLNNSYECVSLTSLARALMLVDEGKAEVTKYAAGVLRTSSSVLRVPKIIRIFRYVRAYGRTFRYSNRGVWERDDYVCQYCGVKIESKADLTADHVLPRSIGGKETYENMVTACTACNRRKGNCTPDQAGMRLLRKPFRPPMSKRMQLVMQEVKAMLAEEAW
mgnify:CR=1 FL=1|tara:strand:- start:452 stop:952 length:501 start_codon:yes stop_codon:yes gene_type:complete